MSSFRFSNGPKNLVDALNFILDEVEGNRIHPGNNVRINRAQGGSILEVLLGTSSISQSPFQVTIRSDPDNPFQYQASVYWDSSLLKTRNINDRQTITGLADSPDDGGNPNWFPVLGNDLIWLEISTPTIGVIDTATIASYGLGSSPTWTPSAPPGESDGFLVYAFSAPIFTQLRVRIPIAQTTAGPKGAPQLRQMLNTNLLWQATNYVGNTADGSAIIPYYDALPCFAPFI